MTERLHLSRTPDPDGELQERQEQERLHACLQKLSTDHQRIIRLFYLEGQSYSDIARQLSTSMPAVRSMLHRARTELRKEMDHHG